MLDDAGLRVAACLPLPIAAAGRSSIRFDTDADARISRSPREVIELTFCEKAGDFVSRETRSATKAFALVRSSTCLASSSGTASDACSGATTTHRLRRREDERAAGRCRARRSGRGGG